METIGIFGLSCKRINSTKEHRHNKALRPSSFDTDLMKVLSCAAFRRLQDKTQLFPLEENDYARTRLTHSCEVAATGKAIAFLAGRYISTEGSKIVGVLNNIVNICCYLHDIGNPPFGHYGEDVIRQYFKNNWEALEYNDNGSKIHIKDLFDVNSQEYNDFVNFDGNAQALRVATKLERFLNNNDGLNLTSAVLGGLIKYPYNSLAGSSIHKFGYFKSEEDVIDFLTAQQDFHENRIHPVALLMEAADDISMFVSDLEDGVKKGIITVNDILKYRTPRGKNGSVSPCIAFKKELEKNYRNNCKTYSNVNSAINSFRPLLYKIKNDLISEVAQKFCDNYELISKGDVFFQRNGKNNYVSLVSLTSLYPLVKMSKTILKEKVYSNKSIILPELKGDVILTNILSHYCESILSLSESEIMGIDSHHKRYKYLRLISKNFFDCYVEEIRKSKREGRYSSKFDAYYRLKLIVDDVCGMTDSFALTLSKELTV